MKKRTTDIVIGSTAVRPGETKDINLFVCKQYDFTEIDIPVKVIRGKEPGPVMFVCAAIHGDEINGVEIIKRLARRKVLKSLKGTLILVPIVNVFGFNSLTRYLPDRRDLNRCFPGSADGSLGAQLAQIFVSEILDKCTHGIDLHTGSRYRTNIPQIRACLKDSRTKRLASHFNVPVVLDAELIEGSLRKIAFERKIPLLVYEGGEPLRYDEFAIRVALEGILSVMRTLKMIPPKKKSKSKPVRPLIAKASFWVRAPSSGIFIAKGKLGYTVKKGELLGTVSDPLGNEYIEIRTKKSGVIIGQSQLPLVNKGDAVFHVATFKKEDRLRNGKHVFDDKFDYEER